MFRAGGRVRAIIATSSRYLGQVLADHLLGPGGLDSVLLAINSGVPQMLEPWDRLAQVPNPKAKNLAVSNCQLCQPDAVENLVQLFQPDYCFILNRQADELASYGRPAQTIEHFINVTVAYLEALRKHCIQCHTVVLGSASVYAGSDKALAEDAPVETLSPDSVAKLAIDLMVYQYHKAYGLPVVGLRAFPPEASLAQALTLAESLAAAQDGGPTKITTLKADLRHDLVTCKDLCSAIHTAADQARFGELYNVCSGQGHSMRQLFELMNSLCAVPCTLESTYDVGPSQILPNCLARLTSRVLIGDGSKFMAHTGWRPQEKLEQLAHSILENGRQTGLSQSSMGKLITYSEEQS